MSETKTTTPKKQTKSNRPKRLQLLFLRGYGKFNKDEVAVLEEPKALPLLDDSKGGPFAEVIQVMED